MGCGDDASSKGGPPRRWGEEWAEGLGGAPRPLMSCEGLARGRPCRQARVSHTGAGPGGAAARRAGRQPQETCTRTRRNGGLGLVAWLSGPADAVSRHRVRGRRRHARVPLQGCSQGRRFGDKGSLVGLWRELGDQHGSALSCHRRVVASPSPRVRTAGLGTRVPHQNSSTPGI